MFPKIPALLIGLTLACIGVALTARSDCLQWHLSDQFTFIRSDGRKFTVGSLRHGREIIGEAFYYEKRLYWGDVKGYIDGHDYYVTIDWQPPRREIYEGHIDAQGHLSGTTYEEHLRFTSQGYTREPPSHRATWYAKERLHCASH